MPEKKEGNTMTCKNCGTELTCRKKDYGGNFASTLQWQNPSGSAHYKTSNGKDFTCNIPEEEEKKPGETPKVPDYIPNTPSNAEDILHIKNKVDSIHEMAAAVFQIMVDLQLTQDPKIKELFQKLKEKNGTKVQ